MISEEIEGTIQAMLDYRASIVMEKASSFERVEKEALLKEVDKKIANYLIEYNYE